MQGLIDRLKKAAWQVALMIVLGVVLAVCTNALRHDGLPLLPPTSVKDEAQAIKMFSVGDAWKLYRQGRAIFLDARDVYTYSSAHLPGAINVPPEAAKSRAAQLKELAKENKVLVAYCDGKGCNKAMELALSLKADRVPGVAVLPEGWQGWMESGYPIEEGNH
jgi:rhodanese-related sulfurtransferase